MNKWTKRLPKKNGYYWFWYDQAEGIGWPEIIYVVETTTGRFVMDFVFQRADSKCVLEDAALQAKYHRYHFGPVIKEPSCRDLRKSVKYKRRAKL